MTVTAYTQVATRIIFFKEEDGYTHVDNIIEFDSDYTTESAIQAVRSGQYRGYLGNVAGVPHKVERIVKFSYDYGNGIVQDRDGSSFLYSPRSSRGYSPFPR